MPETLAGAAAEDHVRRDPVVVEEEFGGVDAPIAHLLDIPGDRESRRHLAESYGLFDQERGEVLVRLRRPFVGAHQNRDERRTSTVGEPHLLSVDQIVVAVACGAGSDCSHVRPQFGL